MRVGMHTVQPGDEVQVLGFNGHMEDAVPGVFREWREEADETWAVVTVRDESYTVEPWRVLPIDSTEVPV